MGDPISPKWNQNFTSLHDVWYSRQNFSKFADMEASLHQIVRLVDDSITPKRHRQFAKHII